MRAAGLGFAEAVLLMGSEYRYVAPLWALPQILPRNLGGHSGLPARPWPRHLRVPPASAPSPLTIDG